jgi:DMSO/TMAO reductase YedYZ molybdopterin-dependent catalytic subunit
MKDRRIGLPVHPVPAKTRMPTVLRLQGLISRRQVLKKAEFAALPHVQSSADFNCEEGWIVPGLRWRGVTLETLIALAQPLPEASHVRAGAGTYEVTLALDSLDGALLCDALDSKPLSREHGGPWRLLVPGDKCFTSVKWVDRLEVTADLGQPTGERIARERLRQQDLPLAVGSAWLPPVARR